MGSQDDATDIRCHGTAVDKEKKRIQCNYCGKVMSGFYRLKHHLGGIRGDVVPCGKVPIDVKVAFKDLLQGSKSQKLSKEVVHLYDGSTPEEGSSLDSTAFARSQIGSFTTAASKKRKSIQNPVFGEVGAESDLFPLSVVNREVTGDGNLQGKPCRRLIRCISQFLSDAGLDFEMADSPSFHRMLEAAMDAGRGLKFPTSAEIKEWTSRGEEDEIIEHVSMVKSSWARTGCSILIDSWLDEKGHTLLIFLADCAQGTIFIKSVDVSDSITDVDKLFLLIDNVIEEVGPDNVVQVITYRVSHIMEGVGNKITEKHRKLFWTICASHCIGLILEEIRNLAHVVDVLDKAKSITKFIYSDPSILKIMKNFTQGKDLIRVSRIKSATPFLTLELIAYQKENLSSMFESADWKTSVCAAGIEGKKIAKLVQNHQFWASAEDVLNAAIPLVCVIRLISEDKKPSTGFIYETMDQVKEKVKKNFGGVKAKYEPLWKIIDDIWDNRLHSPLHCAGYFLNPVLFYSDDFFADAEVASGLLCCIVRMAEDSQTQDLIVKQLEVYRAANGCFGDKIAVEKRRELLPAQWWSAFGGHCPELQRLAIRILSQTCCGASRFELRRRVPEILPPNGVNGEERKNSSYPESIRYNLLLRDYLSLPNSQKENLVLQELDQMTEWIGETHVQAIANGGVEWMDVDRHIRISHRNVSSERRSCDQVKEKLT